MKQKQGGMVLLTTIIMLVILNLLVLSLMQGVFLYIKSTNLMMSNHQELHQMEGIAHTLDLANPACVVCDKNPNQLINLVSTEHGCVMVEKGHQYRYILEEQGTYPCLQIKVGETLYGSQHWLLTLASMQPPHMILQLRVTRPVETQVCDSALVHRINSGVVSWRKLHV